MSIKVKVERNCKGELEYTAINDNFNEMTSNMLTSFASEVRRNIPLIEKPKFSISSIIKLFLIIFAVFVCVALLFKGIDFFKGNTNKEEKILVKNTSVKSIVDNIEPVKGWASGTNLSKIISHSSDKDTDLGYLTYMSLPDQEREKIENHATLSEVIKVGATTTEGKIMIGILLFLLIGAVLCWTSLAIDGELPFFLGGCFFTFMFLWLLMYSPSIMDSFVCARLQTEYIEANIASRAVVIETPKGSINAKIKDVVILKTGKASVGTENGIVITDFKNIKLI